MVWILCLEGHWCCIHFFNWHCLFMPIVLKWSLHICIKSCVSTLETAILEV
jgi:hypothetical protein